jgi:hypothetical protein
MLVWTTMYSYVLKVHCKRLYTCCKIQNTFVTYILFLHFTCTWQYCWTFLQGQPHAKDSHMTIITLLPFFIEMLQYDWLWSGHMIIKEMFYIPIKLKPELARASMTTSDVKNQWRSNFQQQIILTVKQK